MKFSVKTVTERLKSIVPVLHVLSLMLAWRHQVKVDTCMLLYKATDDFYVITSRIKVPDLQTDVWETKTGKKYGMRSPNSLCLHPARLGGEDSGDSVHENSPG